MSTHRSCRFLASCSVNNLICKKNVLTYVFDEVHIISVSARFWKSPESLYRHWKCMTQSGTQLQCIQYDYNVHANSPEHTQACSRCVCLMFGLCIHVSDQCSGRFRRATRSPQMQRATAPTPQTARSPVHSPCSYRRSSLPSVTPSNSILLWHSSQEFRSLAM